MSQKDVKFRDDLLVALSESILTENSSNYASSFKIIEYLVTLEDAANVYETRLLDLFVNLIGEFSKRNDFNADYLGAYLDCLDLVVAKSKRSDDRLFGMIERLVEFCVLPEYALTPFYTNSSLIVKLSLLVKSFVLK